MGSGWALVVRLVNLRNHDLTDVHAVVSLARDAMIFMPLRGLTPESLPVSEPEVVCLISAADETFAQTVHAKTSCDKADIVWDARFRDMYLTDADRVAIDLTRLHDIESVPPPTAL